MYICMWKVYMDVKVQAAHIYLENKSDTKGSLCPEEVCWSTSTTTSSPSVVFAIQLLIRHVLHGEDERVYTRFISCDGTRCVLCILIFLLCISVCMYYSSFDILFRRFYHSIHHRHRGSCYASAVHGECVWTVYHAGTVCLHKNHPSIQR